MPKPRNPSTCQHHRQLFIQDESGGPPHRREHVTFCRDCGTFRVTAEREGLRAVVTFALPNWDLVQAAGQYARLLDQAEGKEAYQPLTGGECERN